MSTLRTALPEIVTATVPGPKAQEVIARRKEAIPNAIGCAYPVVIINIWMATPVGLKQ